MEKSQGQASVTVVEPQQDENEIKPVQDWSPGYRKRFPIIGATALSSIVCLACAALAVLIVSNQMSSATWPQRVAPNVVLSLINSLSSLAITAAVGEGVAIAWWRKAMEGTTVAQLHEQWSVTTSIIKSGFTHPKALTSSIALAVLATQVTLLNNVLYQRSTSTYVSHDSPRAVQAYGIGSTEFPMTGYVVSNNSIGAQTQCDCFMVGDAFTPVVNLWETSNGFFPGYNEYFRFAKTSGKDGLQYCNGQCYTTLDAIGFEFDCVDITNHTDIAIPAIAAYNAGGSPSAYTNLPIFNSTFALDYASSARNYSQINLNLEYFQSDDPYNPNSSSCPGTIFMKQCTLRPALVRYPVSVTNFTNTHITNGVALGTENMTAVNANSINVGAAIPAYNPDLKQADGYQVLSYLYPEDAHTIGSLTALGGVANAISQYLTSSATITFTGDESWSLKQQGTLSQTMMYGPPNMGSCDCSFKNEALDMIINSINQLAFLTGVGLIDTDPFYGLPNKQQKTTFPSPLPSSLAIGVDQNDTVTFAPAANDATQVADVVFYQTHWLFAGLAFGITILCIILVIPSFWHYGQLGRRVTLGPMEIASAFGAPILTDNTHVETEEDRRAKADIDALIAHVGDRRIQYGFVDVDNPGMGHMDLQHAHHPQSPTTQVGSPGLQPQSPHLQTPVSPILPHSPQITVASPPMSPAIGSTEHEARIQKRKSVRLAMGNPEAVRPTSIVVPRHHGESRPLAGGMRSPSWK